MPGWRRTGGYGRTASEGSIPACSSSTWRSWHCCSGDREQVLRGVSTLLGTRLQVHGLACQYTLAGLARLCAPLAQFHTGYARRVPSPDKCT
ncbi:hypothetical protein BRM97_09545 [Xanthomonas oryzae pv. oryzae]|nr:hypothetical protein BRM97_09545 [Xanthomonas oryzae pv. oryzae]